MERKEADVEDAEAELARLIAADLFTNSLEQRARRLVLELPGPRNGGGWSEAAAANRIARTLAANRAPTTPAEVTTEDPT